APQIQPASATESRLSYAQQRLWFLDQMQPGMAIYNIPAAIRLSGLLNASALEAAVREIVRRHEVLRARFINVDGEPQQVITSIENFTPAFVDVNDSVGSGQYRNAVASGESPNRNGSGTQHLIEAEAGHPFDLS